MINVKLGLSSGVVVIEPEGPLEEDDFKGLRRIVDTYLEEEGTLHGVMIRTPEFPGWDSFTALVEHIRFVRDHHKRIEKVALVTDSPVGRLAPVLSKHFVNAEVRQFPFSEFDSAVEWLS